MPDLPSGTVTFLFTDIEGSTRLWERDPAEMRASVTRHDALMAHAIAAHDGHLFKHVGDMVQAAFTTPLDAVFAAVDAQRALAAEPWSKTGPIRARMAIHLGEAAPNTLGDYHQIACLNRLARLLDAGHGGQVLLSGTVRDAIAGALPEGVDVLDLGKHRLRDLLEPESVGQVVVSGLPERFPPLKSLERHPTNLPVQPNALVGREQELTDLQHLLTEQRTRLLTLTGPGGTGKTRLALQVAVEALDRFEDGAFVVDLAPLDDPQLVLPTIAVTLGVREGAGMSLREHLVAYLGDKQLLLVLDNYEHLLAAAPVAADILAHTPNVQILATSRAPLRLKAEHEYPVAPLALPTHAELRAADGLADIAAVALFVQRAKAVRPDFAVDHETAPLIAEICMRLDGLPLAIELAASRVKLLPPRALLDRLERRLPLLTGGTRDAPARQRTLRDTIAWSHDLLSRDEQALFRRVAVFSGGCSIDAAEAVVNLDDDFDVLDGLASLVDKSLLRLAEGSAHGPRVAMLETIREYGLERLTASGEEECLRQRHAQSFFDLAGGEQPSMVKGDDLIGWLHVLDSDHDNLRAALGWSVEQQRKETALRLCANLGRFWYIRGHFSEGRLWHERALAGAEDTPPALLADVYYSAAMLARAQGDQRVTAMHAEATTAAARQAGDPRRTARALYALGVALQFRGETERAADVLEEGLQLARQAAPPEQIASILNVLGDVRYARGDHQGAMALVEEGLALKRAAGDSIGAGVCLNMLGTMALNQRDLPRADACFSEALALFRPIGDRENVAVALLNLGNVARERGENGRAAALFRAALVEFRDLGDLSGVAYSLEAMSAVAARTEHPEPAARWLGVAEAIRETIDEPIPIEQRESYTMAADQLRERLGETAFATLLQAGRMLAWENAAIEALALADELVASTGGQDQLHSDPRGSVRGADDVPLGR